MLRLYNNQILNYFTISWLLIITFLVPFETITSAGCDLVEFAMLPFIRYCVADFELVKDGICLGTADGLFSKATDVATLV